MEMMGRMRVLSVGREGSGDGEEDSYGEVIRRVSPYKHSESPAGLAPPVVEGARRQDEVIETET